MKPGGQIAPYVAPSTIILGLALAFVPVAACGGATTQDVLELQPTASATVSSSGSSGTSGSSGASGSSGTSGSSGASGTSGTSGGGEDAGACVDEDEPNNSPESANTLATSRCGAIQPNSESDFLTFVLSESATSLQVRFDGQVTLRVEVEGEDTVTLGNGKSPAVPFVKNKRYTIEIKATERGTRIPWRVDLIES